MKKLTLILAILINSKYTYAQLENVIIETYYVSNYTDSLEIDLAGGNPLENGTTTYRIYIDLMPGSKIKSIYGDANHLLKFTSTKPFYNNLDGLSFAKDFNNINAHKNLTFALDTWLTIGQTTKLFGGKTNYGILKSQDRNGTTISNTNVSLTNSASIVGIPLTISDGMDTIAGTAPTSWFNSGFITIGGGDSTIFGSTKINSIFKSNAAILKNSGVRGVIPDSNQVLIAQLTTKGELSFELNLEVEIQNGGIISTTKYVANDSIVLLGEEFKSILKYPAQCGCMDPRYLEYKNNFSCGDASFCKNLIVFGCTDTMACNYDPKANYYLKGICCYPGSCGGREISTVCPLVNGDNFGFEIYPNPCQDKMMLNTLPGNIREIKYSIYDTFGTLLLTKNLGETSKVTNEEINLVNLNNGMYLFRLDFGGTFINKLFIKN